MSHVRIFSNRRLGKRQPATCPASPFLPASTQSSSLGLWDTPCPRAIRRLFRPFAKQPSMDRTFARHPRGEPDLSTHIRQGAAGAEKRRRRAGRSGKGIAQTSAQRTLARVRRQPRRASIGHRARKPGGGSCGKEESSSRRNSTAPLPPVLWDEHPARAGRAVAQRLFRRPTRRAVFASRTRGACD